MDNNAVLIRSPEVAANFTAEFEEMFVERRFGSSKRRKLPYARVEIEGAVIETYFSPGGAGMDRLIRRVDEAHQAVHFLAFSFTHDGLGRAVRDSAANGIEVAGVIERSGSETIYSELAPMRMAGVDVLPDANPAMMHHKVFIVDRQTVATGSMNQTASATRSNDENLVLIDDARVAARFEREFERVRALALSARN
jgi:phosphatidylserine/phosphatidylglycerophosphate/cardiolipin synthase-like enzyme